MNTQIVIEYYSNCDLYVAMRIPNGNYIKNLLSVSLKYIRMYMLKQITYVVVIV